MTDQPNWKVTTSEMMAQGVLPRVTLCGACNRVTLDGIVRNTGRDALGEWLSHKGVSFFEVQIHPITHGRGYDWPTDSPKEMLAREVAELRIYEIRPDVMSSVTAVEIMEDHAEGRKSIVWFNGDPTFEPIGLGSKKAVKNDTALREKVGDVIYEHLCAYVSAGHALRQELQVKLRGSAYVHFVNGDLEDVKKLAAEILRLDD